MNVLYTSLAVGLVAFGLQTSNASAEVYSEYTIMASQTSSTTSTTKAIPRLNTGKKIVRYYDPATGAQRDEVVYINVPGIPADAMNVDVVITYTDARGTAYVTRPGFLEAGCTTASTDEGVDVVCPIVAGAQ